MCIRDRDYAATLEKVAAIGYKNLELISTVTENGLVFGQDPVSYTHLTLPTSDLV